MQLDEKSMKTMLKVNKRLDLTYEVKLGVKLGSKGYKVARVNMHRGNKQGSILICHSPNSTDKNLNINVS